MATQITTKKVLDGNGLGYFYGLLRQKFPTFTDLNVIINAIQDAIDGKENAIKYADTIGWLGQRTYIPSEGEIIIYTDKTSYDENNQTVKVPGIKIGDGTTYVVDLPFIGDDIMKELKAMLSDHENNHDIHVTSAEKEFWNNKLNCTYRAEELIFSRL